MRFAWPGTVALALGLLFASSGAGSPAVAPKRMVLQPADLPRGFVLDRARSGPRTNAMVSRTSTPSERAKLRRFGRITGYLAFYGTRDVTKGEAPGVIVIAGNVSLYRSTAGARSALADVSAGCARAGMTPIPLAGHAPIGPQTRLCTDLERVNGLNGRTFMARWRHGRATGFVVVTLVEGAANARIALILGRKQDRRMAAELRRGG